MDEFGNPLNLSDPTTFLTDPGTVIGDTPVLDPTVVDPTIYTAQSPDLSGGYSTGPLTTTPPGSTNWLGDVNTIANTALTWYRTFTAPQPQPLPPGSPGMTYSSTPGGAAVSFSSSLLIVLAVVAIAALILLKK